MLDVLCGALDHSLLEGGGWDSQCGEFFKEYGRLFFAAPGEVDFDPSLIEFAFESVGLTAGHDSVLLKVDGDTRLMVFGEVSESTRQATNEGVNG